MKLRLTETKDMAVSGKAEQRLIDFAEDMEGVENEVVNLYPDRCFETFEGFGGAITDAAGYVYSLMSKALSVYPLPAISLSFLSARHLKGSEVSRAHIL